MSDTLTIASRFRDYSVEFIDDFEVPLRRLLEAGAHLICDATVYALYEARIAPFVAPERLILVEPSESSKTIDRSKEILELLVERQFRRGKTLVALGGGVTQDVTAFAASLLYRGVEWVFFPSTLLAQADSCIGSKTSINLGDKKNLIGNFYPPSAVYIDSRFLETLDEADVRSGIGEMLHFYIYADSPKLRPLIARHAEVIGDRAQLREFIRESLAIKKRMIEVDEFDRGMRNLFNYGHTFGHALESLTDYGIKHGQAVTVGMDLANYLSVQLGLMDEAERTELNSLLRVNFPDWDWSSLDLDRYLRLLAKDKKNTGSDLTCILAEGAGRLTKRTIPLDAGLRDRIRTYFAGLQGAAVLG